MSGPNVISEDGGFEYDSWDPDEAEESFERDAEEAAAMCEEYHSHSSGYYDDDDDRDHECDDDDEDWE